MSWDKSNRLYLSANLLNFEVYVNGGNFAKIA